MNKFKVAAALMVVALVLAAMGTPAAAALWVTGPAAGSPQAAVPVLVSTDWVADHLEDPDMVLIHVAMVGMNPPAAFIPGAVVLDYHSIETSADLPIELPPVAELTERFVEVGVRADKHVVFYGPAPAHTAARAFVSLEYLGHPRVSVMDGGIEAWRAEGRAVSREPAAPLRGAFEPRVNEDMVVDAAWIHARLDDPNVALIDARPADQFAGYSNRNLREGHIPGAANIYFVELLESEGIHRLKPRATAEQLFAAAGAEPGMTIVSYCQIGMRASYNYLIARHLGYDVKFYDASWVEWGARQDLPAETGSGRR